MHRSQRRYSQKNVMLAMTKLKLLGIPEPLVSGQYSDQALYYINGPFSKAPREVQAQHWFKILSLLREAGAKQRGMEHRRRNAENT